MGFLDRFKKKATEVVDDQGDTIGAGLDRASDFVDDKTGGKYDDKLDAGVERAKDALDSLDGKNDDIPDEVAEPRAQTPTTPQQP